MEAPSLNEDEALELVSQPGISLALGYHPRANLNLVFRLCSKAIGEGLKALVLDCDHTITVDGFDVGTDPVPASNLLISHPEDASELSSDLDAAGEVEARGAVVINRPDSLIESASPMRKFEEKRGLWSSVHPRIKGLSRDSPVLILADIWGEGDLEIRVHPALYYTADRILEALEEGKQVESYRISKRRLQKPRKDARGKGNAVPGQSGAAGKYF